jgi:hypothetical protein
MTYIVKHLPTKEQLEKELIDYPDNIRIYMKYEGYQGPDGSIDYLARKIEEYINSKKSNK